MKTSLRLTEAKQHMTKLEKQLHKKLIKLLLDDGKGHHHKKYAMRLKDFNIKVVSLKADPKMTAAISFDLGVIYISEGFLLDESLFFQLNVLMRHELAHNLLMHQIRMMRKFGEDFNLKWGNSMTLHGYLNYIEDHEISDRIYSKEDKDVVRKMFLNGRTIGGLITDDIRPEWVDLPVEQMYHRNAKSWLHVLEPDLLSHPQIRGASKNQPGALSLLLPHAVSVEAATQQAAKMVMMTMVAQGLSLVRMLGEPWASSGQLWKE